MAFRTAAARPNSVVPTMRSFAASGTGCTAADVASTEAPVTSTDDVTAADVVAATAPTVPTDTGWRLIEGADDSSDNANPTGTTNAATSTASNETR